MFAKVAVSSVNYTADRPYEYHVPLELQKTIVPGIRVFVPFGGGNHVREAIVLAVSEQCSYPDCKDIIRNADREPLLNKSQLQLALFMRERYYCTVYDAVKAMIPAGYWFDKSGKQRNHDRMREMVRLQMTDEEAETFIREKRKRAPKQCEIVDLLKSFEVLPSSDLLRFTSSSHAVLKALEEHGAIELFTAEVLRRPELGQTDRVPLPVLNKEQRSVLSTLQNRNTDDSQKIHLLMGVTGSGKTAVYAHIIDFFLKTGKGTILLVPEISLTPQMLALFSGWFGNDVAVLHSALSAGERYDEWKRIRRGEANVVIGTRSAVFAPLQNLGLIIVDEEQEGSYFSEASPRYHAREVARFRTHREGGQLLLGSATPDIQSAYYARTGVYGMLTLSHRYNEKPLPSVHIADMKKELKSGNTSLLSRELRDAVLSRLERKEQSILFLNRRGTNKLVTCSSCGFTYRCPHCSVSMTWHANLGRMICHYCGTTKLLDKKCPACGGAFNFFGAGTQLLETELHDIFPGTEILRVDSDSVSPAGSHRRLFQRFTDEKIPIMIGTQMIAKGLNFDKVTLVGVISADHSLYANDFRAGEKTFSLLTQVIGRCGRSERPGEAYIQTFTPDNEIIRLAASQNYDAFYRREIEMRRVQGAPPFYDWVSLNGSGRDEEGVVNALRQYRAELEALLATEENIQLFGPIPHRIVRMSDRFRYRIQIMCRLNKRIRRALSAVIYASEKEYKSKNMSFYIENEAYN